MKQKDNIFCLFLPVAMVIALLLLSMSAQAQASSNRHIHTPADDFGNREIPPGGNELAHHEEKGYHGEKAEQHLDKDTGHDTSNEAGGHIDLSYQSEVPLAYLFYWGILILVMVIILIYFVYRYKHDQSRPMIPLAIFLVLFGLTIYILEIITPAFTGRFDFKTLRIVQEFHEGPDLGFLRFIYKFILGIFMTFFAFLNLDRKGLKSIKGWKSRDER